jgi:hypothetical protein
MFPKNMSAFCKSEDCPPSADLLDFLNDRFPGTRGAAIDEHLSSCEFCSAEVDLYSHFPQGEGSTNEPVESSRIPAALFELAEALLKKRHTDASSLDALLKRIETVESS